MIRQEILTSKQDDLTYVLNIQTQLKRYLDSMRKKQIANIIFYGIFSRCITSRELKLRQLYHATVTFLQIAKVQGQGFNDAKYYDGGETAFLEANKILE